MKDCVADFYSFNGEFYDRKEKNFNIDLQKHLRIYEVVRVIDGKPLFLEDHYSRLTLSSSLKKVNLPFSQEYFREQIKALAEKNKLLNFNCMMICFYSDNKCESLLYVRKHFYPPESYYVNGVAVDLIKVSRRDPNVKYIDDKYNRITQEAKLKKGVFEVLLVDEDNYITEASKANVFFIKGDKVLTSPTDRILAGITRKYVFQAIEDAGVELVETSVRVDQLGEMEGIFITGTSLHLLPISNAAGTEINTPNNKVFMKINRAFNTILDDYLRS